LKIDAARIAALLLLVPAVAAADGGRQVGAHLFVPALRFEPAFIDSRVGLSLDAGYLTYPDFDAGDAGTFELELAGLRDRLELEGQLSQRISVFGTVDAAAFSGANGRSALFSGVVFGAVWRAGLGAELLRVASTVLGARIGITGDARTELRPSSLVSALIERPVGSLNEAVRRKLGDLARVRRNSFGGEGTLALAQSLGAWVGLQGGVEVSILTLHVSRDTLRGPVEETSSNVDASLGAAIDVTPPQLPLAFIAEVGYRRGISGETDLRTRPVTTLDLGAFFRDGEHLDLGLAYGADLGGSDDGNINLAQLILRYSH
jgi:hypothetical protein